MRGVAIFLTMVLAASALWVLSRDLAPPKSLIFAAGSEGGGYWKIAEQYRRILARDGIEVTLLATKGSVENADLLESRAAQVGLLQGGIRADEGLVALGALFVEPLFLFVRTEAGVSPNPGTWSRVRAAVGGTGSGTRAAVETLLATAKLPDGALQLDDRGGEAGATALLNGEVDMAVFVAPISAPYLADLFTAEGIHLLQLDHIDAVSRRLPQSRVIDLPSGALALAPPLPPEPLPLLTMVATLAAQPDLHPSLVDRLVEAARIIHGGRDVLTDEGDYPTMAGVALRPDAQAGDLIESGPSPLQAYLPYWVVAQINRFAILLLPILFLLLPILRLLPGLYAWRMRHRVFRHYTTIREIEAEARAAEPARLAELDVRLAELDAEIADIRLPLPYREFAYTARLHIDLLRNKIAARG